MSAMGGKRSFLRAPLNTVCGDRPVTGPRSGSDLLESHRESACATSFGIAPQFSRNASLGLELMRPRDQVPKRKQAKVRKSE